MTECTALARYRERRKAACCWVAVLATVAINVPQSVAGDGQDCTCGGEGESICLPWDDPVCYFNNAILPALYEVAANDGCDRGLTPGAPYFCGCLFYVPVPETCGCALRAFGKCIIPKICWRWVCVPKLCIDCQKSSREQGAANVFRGTWTYRKMKEQRVLAENEPVNWVTRIAGHNSYNNAADNYKIPNHTYSITDQLNAGARVIMLDVHGDPGTSGIELDGNLRLSHAAADCVGCNPLDRPAVYAFKEIGEWVADHPDEIVILEIEDYDIDSRNGEDLTGPIEAYLGPWLLRKPDKPVDRWPTRREMLDTGLRAIVFSQTYNDHDVLFDGGWSGLYRHSLGGAKANQFDGVTCDRFRSFDQGGTTNTQVFSEVWEDRSFIGALEPAGLICHADSTACEDPPPLEAALIELLDFLGFDLHVNPLCCNDNSQTTTMRELVECNTAIIGLDRLLDVEILSEPERLREVVWSWQYGYDAPNGHAAKLVSGLDRWQSADQGNVHPFACAKFRENDPVQWADPSGVEWRITEAIGTWEEGFLACIFEYGIEGFTFSVPVSGFQQRQLVTARDDANLIDDVWLAYRDTDGTGNWRRDDGYDPDIWTSQRVVREGEWVELIPKTAKLQNCNALRELIWDFGAGDVINNGSQLQIHYYYYDERPLIDSVEFPVTVTEHYPGSECPDRTLEVYLFVFNDRPDVSLIQDQFFLEVGGTADIDGTTFDSGVVDTQTVSVRWSPQTLPDVFIPLTSTYAPIDFVENDTEPGTTGEFGASHQFGATECGTFRIHVAAADNDGGNGGTSIPVEILDVTPIVEFPAAVYVLFEQDPVLEEGLMSVDLGVPTILEDTICYPVQFVTDAPGDGFPLGLTIVTWTAELSDDGSDCADEESFCEIVAFASQTVFVSECLISGDVDFNCTVNRCDLAAINDRVGEDAEGLSDPADLDADGLITIADVRYVENNNLCDEPDCGNCGCNRWVRTGESPDHLYNAAMVHDVHRGETVLFGGYTSDGVTTLETQDTWLLDANGWSLAPLIASGRFVPRTNHPMAYDLARGVSVTATGGPTISSGDDTWEWNGGRWTKRSDGTTDVRPSSRSGSAMAYDTRLRQIVLFGGGGTETEAAETWIWRNFVWTLRRPPLTPPARRDHVMAYDSTLHTTVLFGGSYNSQDLGDTWEWDGNQWTMLADTGPSPRANAAMAYDPIRQAMILHGGSEPGGMETWTWDSQAWTLVTATGPKAPGGHTLTYDSARRRVVLFVPTRLASGFDVGETWILEGDAWMKTASTPPEDRSESAMVYVSSREQSVLVGADAVGTWLYADGMWASPERGEANARSRHAMAYDELHDHVVLFGGGNCCTGFDDTWVWDAATRTWSEVQGLNPNPLERSRHAMAYDSRRQVVVMFGGEPCSSCGSGSNPGPETWEWDGSSWRLKHDSAPSRRQHAMVYDPVDDVVLLYGGWPTDRETWVYSVDESGQATWTQRFPVYPAGIDPPPGLIGHRMVYDTQRQAVVMFGGKRVTGGEGRSADTWAWDRARQLWLKLDTTNDPPAREDFAMSYDLKRHASVIFGGSGGMRDTWELTSGFPSSEVLSSDQVIVDFGQRLELSIIADGLGPFTYHWFKDGRPIAELGCSGVAGVQTDTLVIEPVNAGDSGSYSVAVSNRCNIDTPLMTSSILVTVDAAIQDCNRNGRDDATDLICGGEYVCSGIAGSFDCDNNGIPDECRAADFDLEQLEDFESIGMGSFTLNGSATVDGGSVRLTEAVNSLLGTVIFEPMSTERMSAFTASFDFQMGQGTSPGADGISFALLDTTLYGPTVLFGEEGPGPASLVLQFDTYDNGELDLSGNFVQISHNGVPVASVEPPFMLDDFRWYHAEIVFAESNLTLTLTPSGAAPVVIFDTVSVFGFVPFVATYGFGGRTGGLNNEQRIDNVYFSTRTSGFACDSADVSPCEGDAGDINADGVVNINDHAGFVGCMGGPGASPAPEKPLTVGRCLAVFDFENDGDVDLLDAAEFHLLFTVP